MRAQRRSIALDGGQDYGSLKQYRLAADGVGISGRQWQYPVTKATDLSQAPTSGVQSTGATTRQLSDQANLSSESGLVALAAASPDVRLDKVAALQQSISNGTYRIPSSAVANKIVDSLLNDR